MGSQRGSLILSPAEGVTEVGVAEIVARYTVGASGALTAVNNSGIYSATRNAAGDYTFIVRTLVINVIRASAEIEGTLTRTDGLETMCAVGTDSTTGFTKVDVAAYPDDGTSTTKTEIKSGNVLTLRILVKVVDE